MINLHYLSDAVLLTQTKDRVHDERRSVTAVLWHLREIEKRRLYSARGYSSLFEYVVKDLGYSEGAAFRRINAMRVLKEIPEVEEKLQAGSVTLSTLSSVQSFCRAEKASPERKAELVLEIEGKSQRETDRMLATLAPGSFKKEVLRPMSEDLTELRIALTQEQLAKLERARELLSHKTGTWAEVFVALAEKLVEQPAARGSAPKSQTKKAATPRTSRYIPRALRQQKLEQANHQCEYTDPTTNRRCTSRHFLEFDHIQPLALGGETVASNLRVLCRSHNQWVALQAFGPAKMQQHWRKS